MKMIVEIWSDTVCPYCYMGKRIYEQALTQFPHAENIKTVWRSYQLDPDIRKDEKRSHYEYMAQLEGWSLEETIDIHEQLTKLAKSAGLDYHFDKAVVANTLDAHRLIHLAKKSDLGSEAEEVLFKAFFTDGQDIADRPTLIKLGKSIGLDETAVAAMLDSADFGEDVRKDCEEAEEVGVEVVPTFFFNRSYILAGSQPVEAFLKILTKSYNEWLERRPASKPEVVSSGKSCSIDGGCK